LLKSPAGYSGSAVLGASTWTDDSLTIDPNITFGDFTVLPQGELDNASGVLDEAGGLATTGGVGADSEALLFAIRVTATSGGQVTFSAEPGEGTGFINPAHFAAVGNSQPIDWDDVEFVNTTVTINNPPHVANPIPDQQAEENQPFGFVFSAATFHDVDSGNILTFAAGRMDDSPLPSWLTFDESARSFSGTPQLGDTGQVHVTVTATDTIGLSADTTFTITVGPDPNPWQNPGETEIDKMDVDDNGSVAPLDVLTVINYINRYGSGDLPEPVTPSDVEHLYVDINGDDGCTPLDVLDLINFINSRPVGEGEGTTASAVFPVSQCRDDGFCWTKATSMQAVSPWLASVVQPTTGGNRSGQIEQSLVRGSRLLDTTVEQPFVRSDRDVHRSIRTDQPTSPAFRTTLIFSEMTDDVLSSDWDDILAVIARDIAGNPNWQN